MSEALQALTAHLYDKQESGRPVAAWATLQRDEIDSYKGKAIVKHKMTTDIFTVNENDSLELVLSIMKWKNIHHMPVINENRELVGILTREDLNAYEDNTKKQRSSVSSIMKKEVFTIKQYESLEKAKSLMDEQDIKGLPVIKDKKLIGLITSKDI